MEPKISMVKDLSDTKDPASIATYFSTLPLKEEDEN